MKLSLEQIKSITIQYPDGSKKKLEKKETSLH